MTSRREFLRSLAAAGALAGLGVREALAAEPVVGPAPRRVSMGLLLAPETAAGRGARLSFEEAQRVGELLHVEFALDPASGYARIGLDPPPAAPAALFLSVASPETALGPPRPRVYFVASSPAFRRQALGRHPDRKDLKVADWHPDLRKFGADALKTRFLRRFHQPMDEAAWHGWMAMKLAVELALRYPGARSADKIGELSIDGHKGMPLRFDLRDHHLIQPVYLIDRQGKMVDAVEPEWQE